VRFRVWNTSSFVILTAAYLIQPYFVHSEFVLYKSSRIL
jgi:hypothetical protein